MTIFETNKLGSLQNDYEKILYRNYSFPVFLRVARKTKQNSKFITLADAKHQIVTH